MSGEQLRHGKPGVDLVKLASQARTVVGMSSESGNADTQVAMETAVSIDRCDRSRGARRRVEMGPCQALSVVSDVAFVGDKAIENVIR